MADREKVIKGLECCTNGEFCLSDCPYFKEVAMTDGRCITALQADALALLKEQDNMISIKAVSDFLAEYALPPTLQKQNLFSFNGNMASEWEQFLRDLKGR